MATKKKKSKKRKHNHDNKNNKRNEIEGDNDTPFEDAVAATTTATASSKKSLKMDMAALNKKKEKSHVSSLSKSKNSDNNDDKNDSSSHHRPKKKLKRTASSSSSSHPLIEKESIETSNEAGATDDHKTDTKSSPKKMKEKKKKKKKRKKNSKASTTQGITLDEAIDDSSLGGTGRGHKDENKETTHAGDNADVSSIPSSPLLEGSIVEGQLVLVDRSNGKVYSMTEKSANGNDGNRLQIGTVKKDGTIVLYSTSSPSNPPLQETYSLQQQLQPEFPFETDPDDHCESPLVAYRDIVPFLQSIFQDSKSSSTSSSRNEKLAMIPPDTLQIYDPYYCNGSVANHLKSLGFLNVYNKKEDCYQVWEDPFRYPSHHDILITNPPYSGDHIEKLLKHITSPAYSNNGKGSRKKNRPWMLLLPQWVHKKDYYIQCTRNIRPFYLIPKKRYIYEPPPSFRQAKKSDVHKKSSPFVSMWYIWGGTTEQNEYWISTIFSNKKSPSSSSSDNNNYDLSKTCDIARSKSALRDLRRRK